MGLQYGGKSNGVHEVRLQVTDTQNAVLSTALAFSAVETGIRPINSDLAEMGSTVGSTKVDLHSLRGELLDIITGSKAEFSSQAQATMSALSIMEKRVLEQLTRSQLLNYPAALELTCASHLDNRLGRVLPPSPVCRCRRSRQNYLSKRGPLGFEIARESDHNPRCPFYHTGSKSWSYSLSVHLYPFVNGTIALIIGYLSGAGGWSVAPPLRFYATVKRSRSVLFRLFDEVIQECTQLVPKSHCATEDTTQQLWRTGTSEPFKSVYIEWDLAETANCLQRLVRSLTAAFCSGIASGSDKDENGHTMLLVSLLVATKLILG